MNTREFALTLALNMRKMKSFSKEENEQLSSSIIQCAKDDGTSKEGMDLIVDFFADLDALEAAIL